MKSGEQLKGIAAWGGRFVMPVPLAKIESSR